MVEPLTALKHDKNVNVPAEKLASTKVHQPVYISMTSTSFRIHSVHRVIENIFAGFVWPDRLYLFLSSEGYLMDEGVPPDQLPTKLLDLARNFPLSIVYTGNLTHACNDWSSHFTRFLILIILSSDNIGAHRKLLPLLARHWEDDVVIVTIDDDTLYAPKFLASFMRSYLISNRSSLVASRVRRISVCESYPYRTVPYVYWNRQHCDAVKNELLVLPTGVGGILYRFVEEDREFSNPFCAKS